MSFPPGQEADDIDLQRAIDAGQQWIDWFTGRTFGVPVDPEARVWEAASTDVVPLVDLQDTAPVVEVDTDGDRTFSTTLAAAQYALEPLDGPPFDMLRAWPTPAGGLDPVCFEPAQLVRITGRYGYTDERGRCPAVVAQANILLGARWFKRRESPMGVLAQPELDVFQVLPRQDADVISLLSPLARPGSPGAMLVGATFPGAGSAWVMV